MNESIDGNFTFIWSRHGETFWGIGNFDGLSDQLIESNYNLTDLEWDGNEIYICDSDDIVELVISGLKIVTAWKMQMEEEYMDTPFDICLSIDNGEEDISPSATLRFYVVRNGEHYIMPTQKELNEFDQPVLMEQVNL